MSDISKITPGDIAALFPPKLLLSPPPPCKGTPFDPSHDYFHDLGDDEKYKDEKGREYPYLRGLQRLAHNNRNGVVRVNSKIIKAPSLNYTTNEDGTTGVPDCIAAVTVTYSFKDGTSFAGSADASYKAHEHPFNLHLVAVAESKAEARAIRRAFNISKVSKEEIGSPSDVVGDPDTGPITDTQIQGINKVAGRKGLDDAKVLQLIKSDASEIKDLTSAEGRAVLKAVNKFKPKD